MRHKLVIGLVILTLIFYAFAPMQRRIVSGGNTITISFDPDGNVSLDVSPAIYNFSTVYASSSETTGATTFTIWNNGTIDNMVTSAQVTTSPADLAINETAIPTDDNKFALYLIGGTASGVNAYMKSSTTIQLDSELDTGGTDTFGFNLYISNLSSNFSWQNMVITLTATG